MKKNEKKIKRQLERVNALSRFVQELRKFHEIFEEVYGYSYGDVDDDALIDSIDYGGGMSWESFSRHMESKQKPTDE